MLHLTDAPSSVDRAGDSITVEMAVIIGVVHRLA
jgi:hypothetical protein